MSSNPDPVTPAAPATAIDPLGLGAPRQARGRRKWLIAAAVLLIAAVAAALLLGGGKNGAPAYETAEVQRGDLTVNVSATGTLQPTNKVDVGSELSGTILSVQVEDNSSVRKGQELAKLDVSRLLDQIASSQAALEVARANVLQARATREEARANLARLREVFALSGGKVPSKAEIETAEAALARADAGLVASQASVSQAQASLSTNQTNLAKASIRSPINGVVLKRQVEPGQTVAASLQAPVLFSLAEDLTRMQLQVKVDEADVGQVREGQAASFTVDAYPGRKYPAAITRVSFGSQTTDNVVSYLTILQVNNDDLSLRPGMTATAEITTAELKQVLLVPNAALRFAPPRSSSRAGQTSLVASLTPRPPRQDKTVRVNAGQSDSRRVWVLKDGQPAAIEVRVGATNGRMTEIVGGALEPGTAVITALAAGAK